VAREVFAADPDGYVAFWHDSFAGMNGVQWDPNMARLFASNLDEIQIKQGKLP